MVKRKGAQVIVLDNSEKCSIWLQFLPALNQSLYSVLLESKILDILISLSRWEGSMDCLG